MKIQLGSSPIIFPMPAVLVGTYNEDRSPNAMTAAWAAACCHSPPCLGVAIRDNRLTFENIKKRGVFTINTPRATDAEKVDYLGIVSGKKDPQKLARLGLKTVPGKTVDAPLIIDCPVNTECKVVGEIILGTHTWFVGEVTEVNADASLVSENQTIDVQALNPLVYATSTGNYHSLSGEIGKSYSIGKKLKQI